MFILLVLGGIFVMAALGFLFGRFYDGPTSAQGVAGRGSSELTTSTRVPVSPGDNGSSADSTPVVDPTSAPAADPTRSAAASPSPVETTGIQDDGGRAERFSLSVTDINGLFPGDHQPLRVLFTNQYPFDVWVTDLSTAVRGTPGCAAQHLVTGTYALDTRVHVPTGSRKAGTVPFGMRNSAPDACQGASLDLRVSATAVKK